VHQIELEMQNEEYASLMKRPKRPLKNNHVVRFSPMGYFTLNSEGILRINFTGADMLAIDDLVWLTATLSYLFRKIIARI